MRLTEYIDFITRTDIGMAQREKAGEYLYFTPSTEHKRQRYVYQCWLKGKEPVK